MSSENSQNELRDTTLQILRLIDKLDARVKKLEEKMPETFDIFYKPPESDEHKKLHLSLDELYGKINRIERELNDGR